MKELELEQRMRANEEIWSVGIMQQQMKEVNILIEVKSSGWKGGGGAEMERAGKEKVSGMWELRVGMMDWYLGSNLFIVG